MCYYKLSNIVTNRKLNVSVLVVYRMDGVLLMILNKFLIDQFVITLLDEKNDKAKKTKASAKVKTRPFLNAFWCSLVNVSFTNKVPVISGC